MKITQLIDFLKDVPLFNHLNNNDLEQIANICSERFFEKGKIIFYEEDLGTSFYIIVSGQVKIVMVSNEGKEHILGLLKERDFFGEISLLDGEPRSATAIALEDTETITITRDDFTRLLRSNPDISLKIMFTLCKRLRKADKQVESLAFLSAQGRVARVILDLADERGEEKDNKIVIYHRMTRQELANIAGTSRETLTRVLMDFNDNKIINIGKNRIEILDKKRLKEQIF
ncbi:MAG: Crp/Fnr family transcriptional regulator [Candidatus Sericytochromatia bacterium]|nr:MAG: Crp/Fnr family transcriptional regulator [Candidatus Sericytochromatia bacterium]